MRRERHSTDYESMGLHRCPPVRAYGSEETVWSPSPMDDEMTASSLSRHSAAVCLAALPHRTSPQEARPIHRHLIALTAWRRFFGRTCRCDAVLVSASAGGGSHDFSQSDRPA